MLSLSFFRRSVLLLSEREMSRCLSVKQKGERGGEKCGTTTTSFNAFVRSSRLSKCDQDRAEPHSFFFSFVGLALSLLLFFSLLSSLSSRVERLPARTARRSLPDTSAAAAAAARRAEKEEQRKQERERDRHLSINGSLSAAASSPSPKKSTMDADPLVKTLRQAFVQTLSSNPVSLFELPSG